MVTLKQLQLIMPNLLCIHTNAIYTDLDYTQPAGEPCQHEPSTVTAHHKLTV